MKVICDTDKEAAARLAALKCLTCGGDPAKPCVDCRDDQGQPTGLWDWRLSQTCYEYGNCGTAAIHPRCTGSRRTAQRERCPECGDYYKGYHTNKRVHAPECQCGGTKRIPRSVAEVVLALLLRPEFKGIMFMAGAFEIGWDDMLMLGGRGLTIITALESAIMAARKSNE